MDPNVLHNLSYGMYIVSSSRRGALNGQIANTVFQITSEPVTIAISVNKKNLTHEFIEASSRFTVSVLDEGTPLAFIGKFGFRTGRREDKFKDVKFEILQSGCPAVLDNAVCYLEVKVLDKLDCGTHTLFLGEMAGSRMIKGGKPLTYDYYHMVKRGTTPKTAPTFVKEETAGPAAPPMSRHRCTVCDYVYDPAIGDPQAGIQPGTPFEQMPKGWACPVCGADKGRFVEEGVYR